ncbi:MAG: sugar phosphate isomerase/epimerase [Lachnospiraceae bacterium]|nr:sugar phosphate isomerase/epimerase [Lachnospiraceae bacterium]
MKLGGFGFIKDYDRIREAGYDYAELDMPEIEALNEKEFEAFREHVQETGGFAGPTGARILPITEPKVFVPGFKETDLESYIRSSCAKNAEIGIKTILFGNGKFRWLVDEDSIRHEEIFVSFMRMLCDIAGENGQEILIEPLGPRYSNYMNTVPEAARVAELVDRPNLGLMADIRHFVWSGESFEDVTKYSHLVRHIHIDFPLSYPERKYPSVRDGYNYGPFLAQLEGFEGTLTIEADVPQDWMQAGKDARELLNHYGVDQYGRQ